MSERNIFEELMEGLREMADHCDNYGKCRYDSPGEEGKDKDGEKEGRYSDD